MLAARIRLTILLLALAPSAMLAQGRGGMGRGGGRGGRGGPAREEGFAVQRPVNAVNLLIEHRQDLTLSDSQFIRVIRIKRVLDSTNAPLMRRLDSVQHVFKGGGPMFGDVSAARRDSLAEAKTAVDEALAGLRENDGEYRDKAYALLSAQQLLQAQTLESKADQALEDEEQKARAAAKP